jgi:hypothetical protein
LATKWDAIFASFNMDEIEWPNPDAADNLIVESAVLAFLTAAAVVASKLCEVSAENEKRGKEVETLKEAVVTAYAQMLDSDLAAARKTIRKVVDK